MTLLRALRVLRGESFLAPGALCSAPLESFDQWQYPARRALLVLALLTLFATTDSLAHPVSIVRSFVYVSREQITARIEVFVEDLVLFHGLKPNDQDFLEPEVVRDGIERHKRFLLERFLVRDVAGRPIDGRVVRVEEPEISPEGIALAELMAHKLVFELRYALSAEPEFLTFGQRIAGAPATIPVEMSLVVKQESAAVAHTVALKMDQPYTVRFSWSSPPLSPEASQEEQDAWRVKQKEETLGITSYSSVYSFLYIDDYEVRHEILIPLLTLEKSAQVTRDGDEFLDIAEQDASRPRIEEYFRSGNPIEIDGVEVRPIVQRCDFYGLDFKDFARPAERRSVSLASARVGIILSYSTKGSPGSVKLTWNRFSENVWAVDLIVYAGDQILRKTLSRIGQNSVYEWQNPGRPPAPPIRSVELVLPPRPTWSVPVISLACLALLLAMVRLRKLRGAALRRSRTAAALLVIGALTWPFLRWEFPVPFVGPPPVSAAAADAIFGALHRNIFRAFDYREEDDIYDALARSVDGGLLVELYLQIRRGLEMRTQGGAVSRIREVRVIAGNRKSLPVGRDVDERGFQYHCRWTVEGTVEHWGHVHARTNQYEALFSVEPRAKAWKITDIESLSEQRVKLETKVRGL